MSCGAGRWKSEDAQAQPSRGPHLPPVAAIARLLAKRPAMAGGTQPRTSSGSTVYPCVSMTTFSISPRPLLTAPLTLATADRASAAEGRDARTVA